MFIGSRVSTLILSIEKLISSISHETRHRPVIFHTLHDLIKAYIYINEQGGGSARDIFHGSGFILQMDHDIVLLFSKCYENT